MKKAFRQKKIEAGLPFICRAKGDKYVVSALGEAAAKIDKMAFAAAKCPGR